MTAKISFTGFLFLNSNFGYYSNNRIIDIHLTSLFFHILDVNTYLVVLLYTNVLQENMWQ